MEDISSIWQYINSIRWDETDFSLEKAYVCSVFSHLAYKVIPEYELKAVKGGERIKIIPCLDYQESIIKQNLGNVSYVLNRADFGQFFIIQRRFAIIIGIRTSKVIIVSVRGTISLYDWMINLNAHKYEYYPTKWYFDQKIAFHRGFYKAILACFLPLAFEIKKIHNPQVPIYVTGHSLGGAMAAIIHAIWETPPSVYIDPIGDYNKYNIKTDSCYTFGMPRFGNSNAVTLRPPYSIYNENDSVPLVPPRLLGFESCYNEYRVDGTSLEKKQKREMYVFLTWWFNLFRGKGIKEHNIELYRDRILEHLK